MLRIMFEESMRESGTVLTMHTQKMIAIQSRDIHKSCYGARGWSINRQARFLRLVYSDSCVNSALAG
jgi:hypothetical protein